MKYLAFDCETGGLDCNKHSLLTAYFSVYDEDFNLIDELDLYLKPSDEKLLNVTQEALKVTQINITDHLSSPNTITYEEGNKLLLKLLEKHKTKGKKRHYRPIGQNLQFDLNFIFAQLISEEDWSKTVHHNYLDTLRIVTFLQDCDMISPDIGNLSSLVEYFDLSLGTAHNAKEDVRMTVEVYRSLRSLIQGKKDILSGISDSSLLEIVEK